MSVARVVFFLDFVGHERYSIRWTLKVFVEHGRYSSNKEDISNAGIILHPKYGTCGGSFCVRRVPVRTRRGLSRTRIDSCRTRAGPGRTRRGPGTYRFLLLTWRS